MGGQTLSLSPAKLQRLLDKEGRGGGVYTKEGGAPSHLLVHNRI